MKRSYLLFVALGLLVGHLYYSQPEFASLAINSDKDMAMAWIEGLSSQPETETNSADGWVGWVPWNRFLPSSHMTHSAWIRERQSRV